MLKTIAIKLIHLQHCNSLLLPIFSEFNNPAAFRPSQQLSGIWVHTEMAKRLTSQLFVSRLSSYTTNEQLKRLFSPFGDVTEARLVIDRKTQRPKGFGFVTYESEVEAQKALKAMNGRIIDGRLIFVEVAQTVRHGKDTKS